MTDDDLPPSPCVVIKVGGSLLSLPDLATRLERLLQQRPNVQPVVIAGGGRIVDEIRNWDTTFSLGEEACHLLAMDALNLSASLMAQVIPGSRLVETRVEAESCWSRGHIPLLRNLAAQTSDVPQTWDVTSDSLAAAVAARWQADELWLLKSTDLPAGITVAEASRLELIDRYFPQSAAGIRRVMWCNLRDDVPRLHLWT